MVIRYGWGELVNFVRDIDAERQALAQMTPASLHEAIRRCLDPRDVRLVVVGPYPQAVRPAVEEYLEDFAAGFS